VLYKGTTLKVFIYQRDEEVIARMHEAIKDFQRRLDKYKNNDEVEWYDIQDTREAASIFDEAEKTEIDLSDKADHVKKIVEIRDMIAELEERQKELEVEIMKDMRDHAYAKAGDYQITWTMINYKATPEKVVPAKPARTIRASKLRIREVGNG
jgi:predicted phage-related endonuclease